MGQPWKPEITSHPSERVSSLKQMPHNSMSSHCRENSLTPCTWKQCHLSAKTFPKTFAQHTLSPGYIIWDGLMLDTQASKAEKTSARGYILLLTFPLAAFNSEIQLYHFKIPKSCALSPVHIPSPALINISKPLTREQTATALQDLLSRRQGKALPCCYPRACRAGQEKKITGRGWMGLVHLSAARKLE